MPATRTEIYQCDSNMLPYVLVVSLLQIVRMMIECKGIILFHPWQWRHNERFWCLNHQHLDCLLDHLFRRTPKKTSKHRVTGLCEGNPPVASRFLSQRANNAENISIWWCHHENNSYDQIKYLNIKTKETTHFPISSQYSLHIPTLDLVVRIHRKVYYHVQLARME